MSSNQQNQYIYYIIAGIVITVIIVAMVNGVPVDVIAQTQAPDVPIGAVIDWWRPNPSYPIPEGFMIADGSPVDDPDSPLDGTTLPDLTGQFIRGALDIRTIGNSGGDLTHIHELEVPSRTEESGEHHHIWADFRTVGTKWVSFIDGYPNSEITIVDWDNGIHNDGAGFYPLGMSAERASNQLTRFGTDREPDHSHSLDQDAFTGSQENHLPPYTELLKIIRVKLADQSGIEAALNNLQDQIDALNGTSGQSITFYNRTSTSSQIPSGVSTHSVSCDVGDQATGGGAQILFGQGTLGNAVHIVGSLPDSDMDIPTGWIVEVENNLPNISWPIDVYVVCADITP